MSAELIGLLVVAGFEALIGIILFQAGANQARLNKSIDDLWAKLNKHLDDAALHSAQTVREVLDVRLQAMEARLGKLEVQMDKILASITDIARIAGDRRRRRYANGLEPEGDEL